MRSERNSGAGCVNQGSTTTWFHALCVVDDLLVGNGASRLEPLAPLVDLHTIVRSRFGHAFVGPVDDDRLLRLLSSLANTNLAFGVVQNVVARVGSVRSVDTDRNSADQPTTVQTEEVLGRVEPNNTTARSFFQADGLGGFREPNRQSLEGARALRRFDNIP